jgi:hypothetical protein
VQQRRASRGWAGVGVVIVVHRALGWRRRGGRHEVALVLVGGGGDRVTTGSGPKCQAGEQVEVGVGAQLLQGARVAVGFRGPGESGQVVFGGRGPVHGQVAAEQVRRPIRVGPAAHFPAGDPLPIPAGRVVGVGFVQVVAQLLPQSSARPLGGLVDQFGHDGVGDGVVDIEQRLGERAGSGQVDPPGLQRVVDPRQPVQQVAGQQEMGVGRVGGPVQRPADPVDRVLIWAGHAGHESGRAEPVDQCDLG